MSVFKNLSEDSKVDLVYKVLYKLPNLSIDIIAKIISEIDYTSFVLYKQVFEFLFSYYTDFGKLPSLEILSHKYPDLNLSVDRPENSDLLDIEEDTLLEYLWMLVNSESLAYKMQLAVQKDDTKEIRRILAEREQLFNDSVVEEEEVTLDNIVEVYEDSLKYSKGLRSGIIEIDEVVKYFSYGTLTVVGGGPGAGKSTFLNSLVYNAVMDGMKVVYLTLEVHPKNILYSLVSRFAFENGVNIDTAALIKGLLSTEELDVFKEYRGKFKEEMKGKIKLLSTRDLKDFTPTFLNDMFAKIDKELGGLDGVIIDYAQLLKFYKPKGFNTPEDFVNYLVRYFHLLSISHGEHGLAVILASQLNRAGVTYLSRKRKGNLSMFAEFNELERSAACAIILNSTDSERLANQMYFSIIKNRTGVTKDDLFPVYCDYRYSIVGEKASVLTVDTLRSIAGDVISGVGGEDTDLDIF